METSNGSARSFIKGLLFTCVILGMFYGCTKSQDNINDTGGNTGGTGSKERPGTNEVWIQGMAFDPSTITVVAGTTITWTNKDPVAHDVTSNSAGLFTSPSLGQNGTFANTFNTPGTYQYKCTIHPGMAGTVIVN